LDGETCKISESFKHCYTSLIDSSEGAQTLAGEMLDRREGNRRSANRDPFGRQSSSGSQSADGTLVPDTIDPQQARKILQELRKRAAEQQRPKQELEYLDRLLERF